MYCLIRVAGDVSPLLPEAPGVLEVTVQSIPKIC